MSAWLPQRCHVVLPGLPAGGNVAVCERGKMGVWITRLNLGGYTTARRVIRELNQSLNTGERAERAMMIGSLIGWDSIADLDAPHTRPNVLLH